jgi:TRAP-type C4-dicarboxylate transport system permease small subunit
MLKVYDTVLDAVDRLMSFVVTVVMAILTTILIVQVFFRYVMNDSLLWGNDVARLSFIVLVLLSIPLVFRFNGHVALDFVVPLGSVGTRWRHRINAVLMMLLSGFAAFYAMRLVERTWDQLMPTLPVSVAWFYVALAVGQAHCCLHLGRILIAGEPSNKVFSEI